MGAGLSATPLPGSGACMGGGHPRWWRCCVLACSMLLGARAGQATRPHSSAISTKSQLPSPPPPAHRAPRRWGKWWVGVPPAHAVCSAAGPWVDRVPCVCGLSVRACWRSRLAPASPTVLRASYFTPSLCPPPTPPRRKHGAGARPELIRCEGRQGALRPLPRPLQRERERRDLTPDPWAVAGRGPALWQPGLRGSIAPGCCCGPSRLPASPLGTVRVESFCVLTDPERSSALDEVLR